MGHLHVVIKTQKTGWDPPLFIKKIEDHAFKQPEASKRASSYAHPPRFTEVLGRSGSKRVPFPYSRGRTSFPQSPFFLGSGLQRGWVEGKQFCALTGRWGPSKTKPGRRTPSFQNSGACFRVP